MCTHLEENYLFPHRHTQMKNLEKVPENPFAIVENNKKKTPEEHSAIAGA